jgi:hypothetical protein
VVAEKTLQGAGGLPRAPVTLGVVSALLYNRGLLLAAAPDERRRRDAVKQFEQYLRITSPASTWWPLAYERYAGLCRDLKVSVTAETDLAKRERAGFRLVTSVKLASGVVVRLGEPVREATAKLGEGALTPVAGAKGLARWRYPEHGVELLAADRVLAICLKGPKAPALPLQQWGAAGQVAELRPGMAKEEWDRAVQNEPYDVRLLDRPGHGYRFYPGLGLAVRLTGDRVDELVLAQIPRKAAPGKSEESRR